MVLSELGQRVAEEWMGIPKYYPQVEIIALQMRAAFEEGLPIIVLLENGFTDLAKPGGKRIEACARGQLLLLAPWEHHNERLTIRRDQCLALNELSRMICL